MSEAGQKPISESFLSVSTGSCWLCQVMRHRNMKQSPSIRLY